MKKRTKEIELAKKALNKICYNAFRWKKGFDLFKVLSKQDKEDCVSEGVIKILLSLQKNPEKSDDNYLFIVAKNAILEYLFQSGQTNFRDRREGKYEFCSFDGWMSKKTKHIGSAPSSIEKYLGFIPEILLFSKKQKSGRALQAVYRDLQILALVDLGWSNREIGQELDIPRDHIKRYRLEIQKRFKKYLEIKIENVA